MTLFGFPLSWRKSRGGLVYTWVGLEKSLREWSLGISASRAAWVDKWLSSALEAKRIDTGELREALGRLVFVYGALRYDRPFLAPLFAFVALHRPGVTRRLPVYVLVVMRWLRDRLRARRTLPMVERARVKNAVLRVDAKAEGLAVAVGGWAPHYDAEGRIVVNRSRWFSVRLTESTAPWAFVKGSPARAISTLELLATTLGLVVLSPPELDAMGAAGTVAVTGLTDSQVSAAVVSRGLTTAFPLCAVAMELSAQLEARGAELFLEWIPREANREADRLADGEWEGFDVAHRVHVDFEKVSWLVLPELLSAGQKFYAEALKSRASGKQATRGGRALVRRKRQTLKERDPW